MKAPVFCVWPADVMFFGILIGLPLTIGLINVLADWLERRSR